MSLLCCSCSSLASARASSLHRVPAPGCSTRIEPRYAAISTQRNAILGAVDLRIGHQLRWSSVSGSRILRPRPKVPTTAYGRTGFRASASWLTTSQIASNAFTWGTIVVLPFYTLMVVAPNATLTKRTMESSVPFVALGVLYAFLLNLSWSPDTLRAMFASKYWLPELSGIAKLFSNEITTASAWIHLLAIDLFAARQVFHDGLKSNVETRHSISLCLLFCPVGVFCHFATKLLIKLATRSQ